jgi:hypothetical protein
MSSTIVDDTAEAQDASRRAFSADRQRRHVAFNVDKAAAKNDNQGHVSGLRAASREGRQAGTRA